MFCGQRGGHRQEMGQSEVGLSSEAAGRDESGRSSEPLGSLFTAYCLRRKATSFHGYRVDKAITTCRPVSNAHHRYAPLARSFSESGRMWDR